MADIINQSDERNELIDAARINAVRAKAQIPTGEPGECNYCGEYTIRLIGAACARCRDARKLP